MVQSSSLCQSLDESSGKNGKGFYTYGEGKKGKKEINTGIYEYFGGSERKDFPAEQIQQRMAGVMINEALLCLQEGILDSAQDGDLGAVLGLGFPPFHGGPFSYTDEKGAEVIYQMLQDLEKHHGPRFAPAEILKKHAESGELFRK